MEKPYRCNQLFVRAGVFLLAALLLFCVSEVKAQQNLGLTTALVLEDQQDNYTLAPYLYVTKDRKGTLDYKTVFQKHVAGQRGDAVNGDVVPLGSTATPHWIIFSVDNRSWTDEWVLSFGQRLDGRVGLLRRIYLYDHISRTKYIDNISSQQNPYLEKEKEAGSTVSVKIPRGKKAFFVMYVMPEPGAPSTLSLELMNHRAYEGKIKNPLEISNLANIFFMVMAGFFLSVVLFKRYWTGFLFASYYIAQTILFHYQNETIYTMFPLANEVTGWLFTFVTVIALMLSKAFLSIGIMQPVQSRAVSVFAIGIVLSVAGASIVIPEDSLARSFVVFGLPIVALFFIVMLSLAQGYNKQIAAYQFAASWVVLFFGAIVSFLSVTGIIASDSFLISAYWYSLVPQGLLFASALATKFYMSEAEQRLREEIEQDEEEKLSYLRENKESSENARLRKMIEHERQVMNELRERENEQNEEMRKAMALADEANRSKSAFLAVISHEIRTPMTGIMGMVRLLLETSLSKEQKDYAQTIQDSGDAMVALLNDILDFEKIESGKMELEHVDIDLHRVVHGIITLMSGHAAAKKIDLNLNMDSDIPRYVVGDAVRLRQVLLNLTGNSIKFTSQGSVTLHVNIDRDDGDDNAAKGGVHRIRFSIEDTGVGISLEAQQNLFNPFSQADSSITRKFGGTGLGLAISQKLVEAMNSKIQIDSTEGQGSTFFFTVLMEEGSAAGVQAVQKGGETSAQTSEKSMRILLVEDNEVNQKLMYEFINRMGHETITAGSGEEAMEIIETKEFDMVLMDIQLPGMTGMGTTKAIRALPDKQKAAVPVIALTGNVQEEDIRQCFAANMNGHLQKPIDPRKLKKMIDKVITQSLDNPVVVSNDTGEFTRVNQLNEDEIVSTAPATSENTDEDSSDDSGDSVSLLPGEREGGDPELKYQNKGEKNLKDHEKSQKSVSESDDRDQVAPIKEFAMGLEDIKITEEDLEEDSFQTAIDLSEEDNENDDISPLHENSHHLKDSKSGVAGSVFDEALLGNLRTNIDEEQLNELLEGLFLKTDEIVAYLKDVSVQENVDEVIARAHELKGMAGNFGLTEISTLAAKLERIAKSEEQEGLEELLKTLPEANQRAKDALNSWVDE